MKYTFVWVTILLISVSKGSFAQGAFTKENLFKDIDIYRDTIDKRHPDPYKEISRRTFYKELERVKKNAKNYNADELLVALMKINAKIQDEHTGFYFDNPTIFPIQAYWFKDGIYILGTDQADKKAIGAKLIAINGTPIEEVAQKIAQIIPSKDSQTIKKAVPQFIISPNILHGLDITGEKQATFTVVNDDKDTFSVTLLPRTRINIKFKDIELPKVPLRYAGGPRSYWFKYDSTEKFMYFEYNYCIDNPRSPFKEFQTKLFDAIAYANTNKLVIDLRENGIGDERVLEPFIDSLSKTALNRKGRIYVLIGRKTYEGALANARELKEKTQAIFVGEPTSSSVYHFENPVAFDLPHTKLKLSYSTRQQMKHEGYDSGMKPDIIIPERFSDFKNGKDAVLDYISSH